MARKKLKKIQEVDSLPNVFHLPGDTSGWLADIWPSGCKISLEVGCGHGDYAIKLAARFPCRYFVGIDVKGARLWTAAQLAIQSELKNVVFLRAPAEDMAAYFEPGQVDEIWIPFPDPFRKKRNTHRRVVAPRFMAAYGKVLAPEGKIHLKTDDPEFYAHALDMVESNDKIQVNATSRDIYADELSGPVTEIQTKYEAKHLAEGKTIKYICFGFQ